MNNAAILKDTLDEHILNKSEWEEILIYVQCMIDQCEDDTDTL